MWNDAGSGGASNGARLERLLSPPRTQLLLLSALACAFVLFRWLQRLEPWNSDDLDLFQLSVDAASGHHWVFGLPAGVDPALQRLPHPAFRIGLLPATIPAIWALGATSSAYYLVPLLFSLLGFAVVYWVMLRHFGALVALLFAVIHVAWPFELEHSSVLLTDLPSAALSLVSFCSLDAAARRAGRAQVLLSLLAGLAAVEAHLLRNNAPLLFAPAYLVFLCFRSTRKPALWASAIIVLGVLGQQGFLVYRGLGWGSDWRATQADFADYAQFLPIHSWPAFLVRQFTYQFSAFGRGFSGVLAALLVAGSLVGHVLLLRFERRVLLLALAAFGLFTWLLFSFAIYERVPGGVRAMVPVNFRFLQPFAYSSLVVWAWVWCASRRRLPRWIASAALPVLLLTFSYLASTLHLPALYRSGPTRPLVEAIGERLERSDAGLTIAGAATSVQVPRLFCCASGGKRVEWRALELDDLGTLRPNGTTLVLRDVPRELEQARYLYERLARQRYREQLSQLEQRLWQDDELAYVDTRYALFAARRAGSATSRELPRNAQTTPPAPWQGAPLLDIAPCASSAEGADGELILVPLNTGRRRTPCAYSALSDALSTAELLPASARTTGTGLVLRLDADFEPPLALSLELVESSERGQRRQQNALPPGASYVPVPLRAEVQALFVVYRVSGGGGDAQTVRVRPAQWRLQSSLARASGGPLEDPAGAAAR